jgi:hypothetical protein
MIPELGAMPGSRKASPGAHFSLQSSAFSLPLSLRQGGAALRAARRRGTGALPGSGVHCAKPGFGEFSP